MILNMKRSKKKSRTTDDYYIRKIASASGLLLKYNQDIQEVMEMAKENPEIAEELSLKLIEAIDESDVAEALVNAKTEV